MVKTFVDVNDDGFVKSPIPAFRFIPRQYLAAQQSGSRKA